MTVKKTAGVTVVEHADTATFTLDVTGASKLVNIGTNECPDWHTLVEVEVDRIPWDMRIFDDNFLELVKRHDLGDQFVDTCIERINYELMKAQVVKYIIDRAA